MRVGLALFVLTLAAAAGPAAFAGSSPYDDPATTWIAEDFAGATLIFHRPDQLGGQAPCNVYGGNQTAQWPAFHAKGVFSTEMACAELTTERAYFDALGKATKAALEDGALVLSDATGPLIRFIAGE
jgi:heat shock protein HslJ